MSGTLETAHPLEEVSEDDEAAFIREMDRTRTDDPEGVNAHADDLELIRKIRSRQAKQRSLESRAGGETESAHRDSVGHVLSGKPSGGFVRNPPQQIPRLGRG